MGRVLDADRIKSVHRARSLRRNNTGAEARLWAILRARRLGGWRWRRQAPFGPFFLDFLCVEASLVVEVDGSQHAENQVYDDRRTAHLQRAGLRVIRFWNADILTNRDGVCRAILDACGGEHPSFAAQEVQNITSSPPAKRRGRG